jgi:hypothetical protein
MEFPWRWLAASSILASGIAGFSLPVLWSQVLVSKSHRESLGGFGAEAKIALKKESQSRLRLLLSLGGLIVVIAFSIAYPVRNASFLNRQAFAALLGSSKTSAGLEEWLPRWTNTQALLEEQKKQPSLVSIAGREVSIRSWLSETRQFTVGEGNSAIATMRTLYYPYWQLHTSTGLAVSTRPDPNGILVADIPPGAQTIEMRFVSPRHQYFGGVLTTLGVLGLASLVVLAAKRRKSLSFI